MRLSKLELENWRGFTSLSLELESDLTLLVGDNGAGKSAILEAIAVALGRVTGGTAAHPPGHVLRIGAAQGSVSLEVTVPGVGSRKTTVNGPPWAAAMIGEPWGTRSVAVLYPADRSAYDLTPPPGRGYRVVNDLLRADHPEARFGYDELFGWFRDREDLENERIRDDSSFRDPALEAVRRAIAGVWPGIANPRLRRESTSGATSTPPRLSVEKEGTRLFLDALSDGERGLVVLGADLARRLAESEVAEPLQAEGIAMVDEIDLHLHPRLQREVIGRLRRTFPNVQWVLTTHSPLVAMHVERRCVRLLESFELQPVPKTFGRDANSLLIELFGTRFEPDATRERVGRILSWIDDGEYTKATRGLDALAAELGEDDVTVLRNRTILALANPGSIES